MTSSLFPPVVQALKQAGGWLSFEQFMALALYAPGWGYYSAGDRQFGSLPTSGSDFITAPEISPLFGQCLAVQIAQALEQTQTTQVWEFGAGSGALAAQLLQHLGEKVERYTIVDVSEALRAKQQTTLTAFAHKVSWVSTLPDRIQGVIVGNEVLDAMPVRLLARQQGAWFERGITMQDQQFVWADRATDLRPPVPVDGTHAYVTEIHPQAQGFIRTLADKLERGAAFFLDYGFPEEEYYHPQRSSGTLMCHRLHQADAQPLEDVGQKDITTHVDFTGLALAAQAQGWQCLGYTSQARFLMNCGLLTQLETASLAERAQAQKLLTEHEMGELFKVIGWCVGQPWDAVGFRYGDRTERL